MKLNNELLKYDEYQLEDFLADEFFIQWVQDPEENTKHFWEKWILEHPEKRSLVMEASSLIQSISYSESPEMSDREYIQLFENIVKSSPNTGKTPIHRRISVWFRLGQVAVISIGLVITWLFFQYFKSPDSEEILAHQEVLVEKSIPKGEKGSLVLEDGTKVYLNAGASLRFPQRFEENQRAVFLEGEAFFEVTKDENRPFLVQTSESTVEVLGTSFNVNKSEESVSVALVSGKVQVKDTFGNTMMLSPEEMVKLDKGGKMTKSGFDPLEMIGWKDRYLVFKNDDINKVKEKLENWYGLEIQLEGEFSDNWSYSGIYLDESLNNTLEGISQTSDIQYSIKNNKIIIREL